MVLAAVLLSAALSSTRAAPQFSWSTVPTFFHGANASGPVSAEAATFLAKFPMVTIDKWQGRCASRPNPSPDCDQETQIIDVLKAVKAINPQTTTIFYYNTVLNFPQYKLYSILEDEFALDPTVLVHDASGKLATITKTKAAEHPLTLFNFSNPRTRELWIQECINATKTGFVDGCYADRATDDSGSVTNQVKLTKEQAEAYTKGRVQALTDLQSALGDGPLIANHAMGPPHDLFVPGSVKFGMIESFHASNSSIQDLLMGVSNRRSVQAHCRQDCRDPLAAFLIGASENTYFGAGEWSSGDGTREDNFDHHWMPEFDLPLGKPLGDATYEDTDGGIWQRSFQHVNVTFTLKTGKGAFEGWDLTPSAQANAILV